jgi:hypothetical protein
VDAEVTGGGKKYVDCVETISRIVAKKFYRKVKLAKIMITFLYNGHFLFSFTKPPTEMSSATLTLEIEIFSEMSSKCFALRTQTIII